MTILGLGSLLPLGSRGGTCVVTIGQEGLLPAESTSFYIKIHIASPGPKTALSASMVHYGLEIILKTTKCFSFGFGVLFILPCFLK